MTAAAANRKFARKRLDWLNVFNTGCVGLFMPPSETCPNAFQIPIIEQNFVEAHNSDSLLVKRLLGDLYLALAGFTDATSIALQANMMRLALKRWEMPGGAQNPPIYNPMLGDDIQFDPGGDDQGDFSEMRAIHEWSHWYESTETQSETAIKIPVVIPHFQSSTQVNAELCDGPYSAGAGSGLHPCIEAPGSGFTMGGEVICNPDCEDNPLTISQIFGTPPTWRLHIDLKFRKGIRLHENQALTIFGGWENLELPPPFGGRQVQQTVFLAGGLRCLIET